MLIRKILYWTFFVVGGLWVLTSFVFAIWGLFRHGFIESLFLFLFWWVPIYCWIFNIKAGG
jgi:hypothetical protein